VATFYSLPSRGRMVPGLPIGVKIALKERGPTNCRVGFPTFSGPAAVFGVA
jgi:hypothetical protein